MILPLVEPPVRVTLVAGSAWTLTLQGTFETPAEAWGCVATVVERVLTVGPDGTATIEATPVRTAITQRGETTELVGGPVMRRIHAPGGELLSLTGTIPSKSAERAAALLIVLDSPAEILPAATWKRDRPADAARGLPPVARLYRYEGAEKKDGFDCRKIHLDARETAGLVPASLEGTVWVDAVTGRVRAWDGRWRSLPIDDDARTVDGSFTIVGTDGPPKAADGVS